MFPSILIISYKDTLIGLMKDKINRIGFRSATSSHTILNLDQESSKKNKLELKLLDYPEYIHKELKLK
jgi:hypothetical protein